MIGNEPFGAQSFLKVLVETRQALMDLRREGIPCSPVRKSPRLGGNSRRLST